MAYSSVDDLLTGDMLFSDLVDKERFVQDAADEMDARLGFLYALPFVIDPTDPDALPDHQVKLLRNINNKLASGRLLLTVAAAGEHNALHAYGLRLVTEAMNDLMLIANGEVILDHDTTVPASENSRLSIYNHDAESAVDMFESTAMRGEPSYWNPGAVVSRMYPSVDYHRLTD